MASACLPRSGIASVIRAIKRNCTFQPPKPLVDDSYHHVDHMSGELMALLGLAPANNCEDACLIRENFHISIMEGACPTHYILKVVLPCLERR